MIQALSRARSSDHPSSTDPLIQDIQFLEQLPPLTGSGPEPSLPFPMESDQNETFSPIEAVGPVLTPTHKHSSSLSTPTATTPSPSSSDRRQRSSSNPSDGASVKHSAEHDSFTTVRLSEPPARQLTLNTNVSTYGTIQDRRSLFGNTLSPASASISPGPSPLSASRFSRIDPNECLSPVTSIPSTSLRPNLQDELEGLDDDSKTISGKEEDDDESDEEEVDWDTLQSKEDAESNLNEEDVGALLIFSEIVLYIH